MAASKNVYMYLLLNPIKEDPWNKFYDSINFHGLKRKSKEEKNLMTAVDKNFSKTKKLKRILLNEALSSCLEQT